MTRALVHVPPAIRAGQPFELRLLVQHPMETGFRADGGGGVLARNIVRRVEARLDGEPVFAADLHPAIAANPLLAFWLRVDAPGTLEVAWRGDRGFEHRERVALNPQP